MVPTCQQTEALGQLTVRPTESYDNNIRLFVFLERI